MANILYFAWVREATGVASEVIDMPEAVSTARDVAQWLSGRSEGHARAFADLTRIRCAIDHVMSPLDSAIGRAGEIAFFPPVTGG